MNTALLVIDMLDDLDYPAEEREDVVSIIPKLNDLIGAFHQNNLPIFHCLLQEGPEWNRIFPEIRRQASDVVLPKLRESAFWNTNLADELSERDVGLVVVSGMVSSLCVRLTALGAIEHGFKAMIAMEAVWGDPAPKEALDQLQNLGVSVVSNTEVLSEMTLPVHSDT